jgi:hypothetical protein
LHQEIERCAYFLYEQRGSESGHALDDWLEAERRLMNADSPQERLAVGDSARAVRPAKRPGQRSTELRHREPAHQ